MGNQLPVGSIAPRGFNVEDLVFPIRRVGDLVDLRYGKALVEAERRSGTVPVFGTNGPCGWHDRALDSGPGVILGRKGQGHLGVKWSAGPFWVIDTAYYVALDSEKVDPRWFYYVTKYVGLDHLKDGEKPGLNRDVFRSQVFPFPPLNEQRGIANLLGTLDDAISLLSAMNRTLDDIVMLLYRQWYSRWEDQEPRATSVQRLIDDGALIVGDGYRAKRSELAEVGVPFARAGNIDQGFQFKGAELLGARGVYQAGNKVSNPHDVVFTSKGTVGRFAFVLPSTPAFVYSPQLCFWRSLDHTSLSPFFLLCWMRSPAFLDQVNAVKGDTDMADYVSLGDQRRMHIVVPPTSEQAVIDGYVRPLVTASGHNVEEISALSSLRDLLMPRLLSGEVRLREAHDLVQALR